MTTTAVPSYQRAASCSEAAEDVDAYPYQVGRMVYRTLAEAVAAIERAQEIYPEHEFKVVVR